MMHGTMKMKNHILIAIFRWPVTVLQPTGVESIFLKIYCKESMYIMFKDKLQKCAFSQFESIFKQWKQWNRSE